MEYAIGIILAIVIGLYGTLIGFDKERSFYPVVLVVIANLYILFAASGRSTNALLAETLPMLLFVTAASIGFRRNAWIVVAGLALHGVFDAFHHAVINNPGVPSFWPGFCLTYDVTAALYLALLILIRKPSQPSSSN